MIWTGTTAYPFAFPVVSSSLGAIVGEMGCFLNLLSCEAFRASNRMPFTYNACPMSKAAKKKSAPSTTIAVNKRARHDYTIEDQLEAGLVLEGWEVKSLRAGRVQLAEGYVLIKNGEAWLFGAHISALPTASSHVHPDATRTRKLLLNRAELNKLIGAVERKGYTLVPLNLHWKRGRAKLEVGLAKGKKTHDKRAAAKDRDWQREKERLMKNR